MGEAYVVEAVRTAVGKKKGALSEWRADDLLAFVLRALVERAKLDPKEIEDVITGCVTQVGEQGLNIARTSALMAGFPVEVCGTSVNRMCGSSQQAFNFAAMAVMSGQHDVVVASGVEVMTRTPMGSDAMGPKPFFPPSEALTSKYEIIPQGLSAERVAEKWDLTRRQLEELSLESHKRAAAATDKGYFAREIVALDYKDAQTGEKRRLDKDEGIRRDSSLEKLASLEPSFKPGGCITAGTSSQISDGASALLVVSKAACERLGLKPRARVVATAIAGADPTIMLTGPIPATRKVLGKAGLTMEQIDLVEINEAFASVPLAWQRELKADLGRVNVNGGAIALGHPLGCSGGRLLTTLLHELERRDVRYGLSTMCIGFGQATATILDRKV